MDHAIVHSQTSSLSIKDNHNLKESAASSTCISNGYFIDHLSCTTALTNLLTQTVDRNQQCIIMANRLTYDSSQTKQRPRLADANYPTMAMSSDRQQQVSD